MTIAAHPASQRRFSSPPAARQSRNTMSSRPPQTLSSRAHIRHPHPRPRKSPSCRLPAITPAAFRPRRPTGDLSAILKSP